MKIILYGKNIELTPAIRTFAEEKISSITKFLKEKNGDLIETRIELAKPSQHHKSGSVFYAEVNLKIGSKLIRCTAEHSDLYAAIDQVRDELEIQIKKFKEKRVDSARKPQ